MIQKLKQKLLILASMLMLALPAVLPAAALAASDCSADGGGASNCIQGGLCSGAQTLTVGANTAQCKEQDAGLQGTIATVVNVLSVIVGVVAVIMIVIGGFRYVTSGGKQESVTAAKNTILYALVGLVIVALAQVIVRFVLTRTTSTS
jgi:lysylphosphatidylglycerol synthetase-like protein (DUF2156 family)